MLKRKMLLESSEQCSPESLLENEGKKLRKSGKNTKTFKATQKIDQHQGSIAKFDDVMDKGNEELVKLKKEELNLKISILKIRYEFMQREYEKYCEKNFSQSEF
ncbi:hypothetical protein QR98_0003800 [Sarcoptes scabiei]|uniref:Uncharacterized protein n=1 Tax=Sarcoptes scabiei TaxID=52283 RepID=A0A131ZT74_SARSC|nr:hypothetical protein QR98_0003800 [Sarcoptes scabiei]